jgi:hypothetical protein
MVPRNGYAAMFLELKTGGSGRASEEQKVRIERLNRRGYLAIVVFGWVEAAQRLCEYLGFSWADRWIVAVEAERARRIRGDWCIGALHSATHSRTGS